MALYKTTDIWYEDGMNDATIDILIFGDSPTLFTDIGTAINTATEVNVFSCDSTKKSLEGGVGTIQTSSLNFAIEGEKIETAADVTASNFVLTAANLGTDIYCARLINPTAIPTTADFVFRGKVNRNFSGEDLQHYGDEFDGDITPLRTWSGTANVIDLGVILNKTVGDCVDTFRFGVDEITGEILLGGELTEDFETWYAANVEDRVAYFSGYMPSFNIEVDEEETEYGYGQTRYAKLVHMGKVFRMLLAQLDSLGIELIWGGGELDLMMVPARWNCAVVNGKKYRFVSLMGQGQDGFGEVPVKGYLSEAYQLDLDTFNVGELEGSFFMSWYMLLPEFGEQDKDYTFSWRALTVAELLNRLAYTFGAVIEIIYSDLETIVIQLKSRSAIGGGTNQVYFREATQSKVDIAPIDPEAIPYLVGAAHHMTKEGSERYVHDRQGIHGDRGEGYARYGSHGVQGENLLPKPADAYLPLTVSATRCEFLEDTAEESGIEFEEEMREVDRPWFNNISLPHNVVFYSGANLAGVARQVNAEGTLATGAYAGANREGLHTAIYVKTVASEFNTETTGERLGVGAVNFAPILKFFTNFDGAERHYNTLEEYNRDLRGFDTEHYANDNNLEKTFPGIRSPFRSTPLGTSDWRNIQPGYKYTEDGEDWFVLEVDIKRRETTVKLQRLSRYSTFTTPTPYTPETEPPTPPPSLGGDILYNPDEAKATSGSVKSYKPADDLVKFMFVSEVDRLIYTSAATAEHYSAVRGICLADYDPEINTPAETVPVQSSGKLNIGNLATTLGLSPGDRLYLHNDASPVNWSNVPPDPDNGETLFYEFGHVLADGRTIMIEPKEKFLFT